MRYSVHIDSAPYENSSFVDKADALQFAYMMSQDYGYAEVRHDGKILDTFCEGR
ncbi:hypothetical protein [Synechococcus phage S-B68]|nr:hypothetical protein [Synechococcus phage S-B68]